MAGAPPSPLSHPAALIATGFGLGLIPKAPGTAGALAALPLAWLLHALGGVPAVAAAALAIFALGWWAAAAVERRGGPADPSYVVIDEVAGQLVALAAVAPGWLAYAAAFALFRLFDIAKPWPISWADRSVKGGLGVMLDDIIAGAAAAVILLAAKPLIGAW